MLPAGTSSDIMGDVLNYGRAAVDALGHRLAEATSPENIMAEIGKTNA